MPNLDDYYENILEASRGEVVRDSVVECFKIFNIEMYKPTCKFVPDGSLGLKTADGKYFKCIQA